MIFHVATVDYVVCTCSYCKGIVRKLAFIVFLNLLNIEEFKNPKHVYT